MRKYTNEPDKPTGLKACYSLHAAREFLVRHNLRHALRHLPPALTDQRTMLRVKHPVRLVAGHAGLLQPTTPSAQKRYAAAAPADHVALAES